MIVDNMSFEDAIAILGGELIPTDEEARNGWDTTALTIYHASRQLVTMDFLHIRPTVRPKKTNSTMKWYGSKRA